MIEGSDNRRAKITGINGVGRVGLRLVIENSDNTGSDNRGSTVYLNLQWNLLPFVFSIFMLSCRFILICLFEC